MSTTENEGQGAEEEFLEEVEFPDDSDDGFEYGGVEEMRSDDDESQVEEDLETAIRVLKVAEPVEDKPEGPPKPVYTRRPEQVDDFVRNFLVKLGMSDTLDVFQREFYELKEKGKINPSNVGHVPDVYQRNQILDEDVSGLRTELENCQDVLAKTKTAWDKLRKERDYHRMHHKRVLEEKKKLVSDMKRLKAHYEKYEPALEQQKKRYDIVMREKSLVKLESEKLRARIGALESTLAQLESAGHRGGGEAPDNHRENRDSRENRDFRDSRETFSRDSRRDAEPTARPARIRSGKKRGKPRSLMPPHRTNPNANIDYEPIRGQSLGLNNTIAAHDMSIGAMDVHPSKPIIATVSDDLTWKIWSVPMGLLICSGEGHKDWIGGVAFHPQGSHLATSSGDCTVKLWNFAKNTCTMTLAEHTQAVWGVSFHDSGDHLVSCSMDHTARLWDVKSRKCVVTLRGHVNSVNAVCFQPFTSAVCTGSGDKTVSLWDTNTTLCTQTFFGHRTAVNDVAFSPQGTLIASTDAEGVVKVWDIRKSSELLEIQTGGEHPFAANDVAFDRSGKVLAIASDDGTTKVFSLVENAVLSELKAEDAVQAVAFSADGQLLMTAGSDAVVRVWS